jgi:hypothetical protein
LGQCHRSYNDHRSHGCRQDFDIRLVVLSVADLFGEHRIQYMEHIFRHQGPTQHGDMFDSQAHTDWFTDFKWCGDIRVWSWYWRNLHFGLGDPIGPLENSKQLFSTSSAFGI